MSTQQTAFRLPEEVIERIDAFAARLTSQTHVQVTRTDAVRILLRVGLDELELPVPVTPKKKAKKR